MSVASVAYQVAAQTYHGVHHIRRVILDALSPAPEMTVWEWADKYRRLVGRFSKEKGKWSTDRAPYTREIAECLSSTSPVKTVAWMKGAQVSGTETGNNWIAYSIDVDPGPMMIVSPTLSVAKRTSARFQAIIDADETGRLQSKVLPPRKKDSGNSIYQKIFPGGILIFAGANSGSGLRSTAAGKMFFDEVEAYPPDVDGEGSAIDIAEARSFTFGEKRKTLYVSTPAVKQTSIIEPLYLKGDQRRYFMPCPHCRQFIDYQFRGRLRWQKGDPESVRYICQACEGEIHEGHHKQEMLAAGRWVPKALFDDREAMARISTCDFSQLEAFNRKSFHRSYHLSSLYAPHGWLSWKEIARRWDEAQGNPGALKAVINTILGETWIEQGEAPEWDVIYARREPFNLRTLPFGTVLVTAGADVGIDHVEIHVWAWGQRRERYLVDYIRVNGKPETAETWLQVDDILNRRYPHAAGGTLPIRKTLVDSNHRPDLVIPWLKTKNADLVVGCVGDQTGMLEMPLRWSERKRAVAGGKMVAGTKYVTVGASFLKLELMGLLNLRPSEPGSYPPGWVHVPRGADGEEELGASAEWCKQLTAERVTYGKTKTGKRKRQWDRIGDRRAEALDCAVYARAAASLCGWDTWSTAEFERRAEEIRTDALLLTQAAAAAPHAAPAVQAEIAAQFASSKPKIHIPMANYEGIDLG